jgi:hypothetical protein
LRRERDDESVNAGHDAAGQRHRRRGDARCIACITIGLLTGKLASLSLAQTVGASDQCAPGHANSKTLFNGAADSSRLCSR